MGSYPLTIARSHRFFLRFFLPLVLLAGCTGGHDSTSSQPAHPDSDVTSGQYHSELFSYSIDNLNRLEEFDAADAMEQIFQRLNAQDKTKPEFSDTLLAAWPEPEMQRQIVERLNQWIRTQTPPADWKPDPMLATLPKSSADLPALKELDRMEFSRFDGYALQEAVWLRDIGRWGQGQTAESLERAKSLFDWTVRNIQIEASGPQQIPQFPWETLLYGNGTAADRAWVFILLCRQVGIDAAILGLEKEVGADAEARPKSDAGAKAKGAKQQTLPGLAPQAPRPWCVAVLLEGNAYLFDPLLGLPIPAPGGVKFDEAGQLVVQPATLAQAATDEKVLQQLDVDKTHVYGVKATALKHVVVMLDASPSYLARRMKLLEAHLAGEQKMVLSASPSTEAARWKALAHVGEVRLWSAPFETLQRRSHLDRRSVQAQLARLLPFYGIPAAPLRRGRILHLKGKFVGSDGAISYYQLARPSNAELSASSAHPMEKVVFLRGKQDASYWSGLIAYQRANYAAAVDYFARRTLELMPDGPWTEGARYNLARTFEAADDTERAILLYASSAGSRGYLGALLRANWLKKKPAKAQP
jgi:hypothetical protein